MTQKNGEKTKSGSKITYSSKRKNKIFKYFNFSNSNNSNYNNHGNKALYNHPI